MSVDTGPDMDLSGAVAGEIRAEMGRQNISRSELSRRLDVDDTWVGKRLNGRTEIGLADLQRIAGALGLKSTELVRRAESLSPTLTYTNIPDMDQKLPRVPFPRGPLVESHPGQHWRPPSHAPEDRRTSPVPVQRV